MRGVFGWVSPKTQLLTSQGDSMIHRSQGRCSHAKKVEMIPKYRHADDDLLMVSEMPVLRGDL